MYLRLKICVVFEEFCPLSTYLMTLLTKSDSYLNFDMSQIKITIFRYVTHFCDIIY